MRLEMIVNNDPGLAKRALETAKKAQAVNGGSLVVDGYGGRYMGQVSSQPRSTYKRSPNYIIISYQS